MVGQSRIFFCKTSKENFNNSTLEASTAAYPTGSGNIAEADSHLLITFVSTPPNRSFAPVLETCAEYWISRRIGQASEPISSQTDVPERRKMCRKLPTFTRTGHQSIEDRFAESKAACQGRFICVDVERRKNAVGVMRDAK
jgi:hypothetical protein